MSMDFSAVCDRCRTYMSFAKTSGAKGFSFTENEPAVLAFLCVHALHGNGTRVTILDCVPAGVGYVRDEADYSTGYKPAIRHHYAGAPTEAHYDDDWCAWCHGAYPDAQPQPLPEDPALVQVGFDQCKPDPSSESATTGGGEISWQGVSASEFIAAGGLCGSIMGVSLITDTPLYSRETLEAGETNPGPVETLATERERFLRRSVPK